MSWTTFRNKKFFYYFICCHFHRNFWPWKVCYRVLRSKIFGHAFVFPYSIWNIVNMQAVNVITSHCLMQCDFFSRFVNYNFFLRSRCCVCVCVCFFFPLCFCYWFTLSIWTILRLNLFYWHFTYSEWFVCANHAFLKLFSHENEKKKKTELKSNGNVEWTQRKCYDDKEWAIRRDEEKKKHRRKKRNDYAKINANTVFLCVAQIFDAIVKTTW